MPLEPILRVYFSTPFLSVVLFFVIYLGIIQVRSIPQYESIGLARCPPFGGEPMVHANKEATNLFRVFAESAIQSVCTIQRDASRDCGHNAHIPLAL